MKIFALSAVVILLMSSCAGFKQNRLPTIPEEAAFVARGSMPVNRHLLFLSTGWTFEKDENEVPKEDYTQYQAYADSQNTIPGIFHQSSTWQVVNDSAVADIKVDLQIKFHEHTRFGNVFLTVATLFIVPYLGSSEHEVHVLATNRSGETILEETLQDGINEWMELLLLPVMPFATAHGAEQRAFENTLRTVRLHLDQALQSRTQALPSNEAQ